MFLDSQPRQPLYGVIGILVILFGSAIAAWLYLSS